MIFYTVVFKYKLVVDISESINVLQKWWALHESEARQEKQYFSNFVTSSFNGRRRGKTLQLNTNISTFTFQLQL